MFHVKQNENEMYSGLRCIISVRLFKDEKCFGPGIAELLDGVEELSSLRAATMRMGMAYSKAWRVMHECEQQLGFKLIDTVAGGKNGGGARVTEQGRDLLEKYRALQNALANTADAVIDGWKREEN